MLWYGMVWCGVVSYVVLCCAELCNATQRKAMQCKKQNPRRSSSAMYEQARYDGDDGMDGWMDGWVAVGYAKALRREARGGFVVEMEGIEQDRTPQDSIQPAVSMWHERKGGGKKAWIRKSHGLTRRTRRLLQLSLSSLAHPVEWSVWGVLCLPA
jgi:hypothetical protein